MVAAVLPAAVLGAAASAASFVAQVRAGASPDSATSIAALFVLAEAAGFALGGRTSPLRAGWQCGVAALGLLALVVSSLAGGAASPLLAVLLSLVGGAFAPWRAVAIQQLASDSLRATAASLASAADMACSTVLLPLAALAQRRHRR
jgi:hypothetical protein